LSSHLRMPLMPREGTLRSTSMAVSVLVALHTGHAHSLVCNGRCNRSAHKSGDSGL
jgi:hypothetical protein